MENIIHKLSLMNDEPSWKNWTLEDIKKLLDIYLIISKNEDHIFKLIYSYHGTDSWEDIFRDYDENYLRDKAIGVEVAINEIEQVTDWTGETGTDESDNNSEDESHDFVIE